MTNTTNTPTTPEVELIRQIGLTGIALVAAEVGRRLTDAEASRAAELAIAHAFDLLPEVRRIIADMVWDRLHP